jgi:hypothetical protein
VSGVTERGTAPDMGSALKQLPRRLLEAPVREGGRCERPCRSPSTNRSCSRSARPQHLFGVSAGVVWVCCGVVVRCRGARSATESVGAYGKGLVSTVSDFFFRLAQLRLQQTLEAKALGAFCVLQWTALFTRQVGKQTQTRQGWAPHHRERSLKNIFAALGFWVQLHQRVGGRAPQRQGH